MIRETVLLAIQAIFRNALRSFLTVLGVVIGVGAVIAMVTIGNGTTAQVQKDLSSLGTNLLFLRPGQGFGPSQADARKFTLADVDAITRQIGGLRDGRPDRHDGRAGRLRQPELEHEPRRNDRLIS